MVKITLAIFLIIAIIGKVQLHSHLFLLISYYILVYAYLDPNDILRGFAGK